MTGVINRLPQLPFPRKLMQNGTIDIAQGQYTRSTRRMFPPEGVVI